MAILSDEFYRNQLARAAAESQKKIDANAEQMRALQEEKGKLEAARDQQRQHLEQLRSLVEGLQHMPSSAAPPISHEALCIGVTFKDKAFLEAKDDCKLWEMFWNKKVPGSKLVQMIGVKLDQKAVEQTVRDLLRSDSQQKYLLIASHGEPETGAIDLGSGLLSLDSIARWHLEEQRTRKKDGSLLSTLDVISDVCFAEQAFNKVIDIRAPNLVVQASSAAKSCIYDRAFLRPFIRSQLFDSSAVNPNEEKFAGLRGARLETFDETGKRQTPLPRGVYVHTSGKEGWHFKFWDFKNEKLQKLAQALGYVIL